MANSASTAGKGPGAKKKKKKGKGGLIVLIIFILLLAGGTALLYFNVYDLRSMFFGVMRDVPVVGGFFPEAEATPPPGRFANTSTTELVRNIENLERQVETLKADKDAQQEDINAYKAEIERLQEFEAFQVQVKKDQENFFAMVYNEAPMDFWQFYQQMNPEQAAGFAQQAAGLAQNAKEIRSYLDTIRNMDEKAAAQLMENLMDSGDANLARDIMNGLTPEQSGAILEKMDSNKRSVLYKMMKPEGF